MNTVDCHLELLKWDRLPGRDPENHARSHRFLTTKGKFLVNELNTIPGFTTISMYPKLWELSGVPFPRLLDELIRLALERHKRKRKLRTKK